MKKITILFFIIKFLTTSEGFSENKNVNLNNFICNQTNDTLTSQIVFKGALVEVSLEKAIYHSDDYVNFFIKISIKNIGNKAIGIDLSNYWNVIYPNQWGFYPKPFRETIDEEQIVPDKNINKADLNEKFKNKSLKILQPSESIDYFRDWNGSGEKVDLTNPNEFLIISFDGQLFVTNGNEIEHLNFNNFDEEKRVLVLKFPIVHKTIPKGALIIK